MNVHQTRSNKMNVYCGTRESTHNKQKAFFFVNLKNVWTSNKKQQNECVLWNKGLNHKQKLCELQKWYGHQTNKKQQNKTKCVLWSKGFFYNRQKLCELNQ
jgi:hypothetical protein